jgi:hypothetical protein
MGKMQRRKGYGGEREVVHLLESLGVKAHRVPLSGAMANYKDDIILEDESTVEVKRRKKISTFLYDLLKTADYGMIREDTDRSTPIIDKWLVVMDLKKFTALFKLKILGGKSEKR